MPHEQEAEEPKPSALHGKTSEVMACVLSSGGVAGGTAAAVMHAGLAGVFVVMIVPQVPSLVHTFGLLATRRSQQRHENEMQRREQDMQRREQQKHQKITDAALKDPADPNKRSLMEDYARTRPGRIGPYSCKQERYASEDGNGETDGLLSSDPPPPTPIGRSA